jgi:hypothetical protein
MLILCCILLDFSVRIYLLGCDTVPLEMVSNTMKDHTTSILKVDLITMNGRKAISQWTDVILVTMHFT